MLLQKVELNFQSNLSAIINLKVEQTCTRKQSQSQWNSFARTCLEGTVVHLEFSIEIQSNNLT